ncbi:hypothetical protein JCM10908_006904 [Rhodotorula pacifica]|uniref:uncharacterized protein n=1 Tax=Rhodotorula pacifica TaxID=1495444 RepID=UPI0031818B87
MPSDPVDGQLVPSLVPRLALPHKGLQHGPVAQEASPYARLKDLRRSLDGVLTLMRYDSEAGPYAGTSRTANFSRYSTAIRGLDKEVDDVIDSEVAWRRFDRPDFHERASSGGLFTYQHKLVEVLERIIEHTRKLLDGSDNNWIQTILDKLDEQYVTFARLLTGCEADARFRGVKDKALEGILKLYDKLTQASWARLVGEENGISRKRILLEEAFHTRTVLLHVADLRVSTFVASRGKKMVDIWKRGHARGAASAPVQAEGSLHIENSLSDTYHARLAHRQRKIYARRYNGLAL